MLWEFAPSHSALSITEYMSNADFDRNIDNEEYSSEGGDFYVYKKICEGVDVSKSLLLEYAPFVTDNDFRHILNELISNFLQRKFFLFFATRIVLK